MAGARLGEICGEYLSKGKQVYIEGRLQTRSWEDKEGNKRYTTEINAQVMQMLGPAGKRARPERISPRPVPGRNGEGRSRRMIFLSKGDIRAGWTEEGSIRGPPVGVPEKINVNIEN